MKYVYYCNPGTVKIPVIRHGTDLSTFTSVWCATRPSDPASATPGVDYVPSSRKVEFGPGITEQVSPQQPKCLKVKHPMVASTVSSSFFKLKINSSLIEYISTPVSPPSTPPNSSHHPFSPNSRPLHLTSEKRRPSRDNTLAEQNKRREDKTKALTAKPDLATQQQKTLKSRQKS